MLKRLLLCFILLLFFSCSKNNSNDDNDERVDDGVELSIIIEGEGTVTSTPSGIDCGDNCSSVFSKDSEISLQPTPGQGYAFAGWTTEECDSVIQLNTDLQCTATFEPLPKAQFELQVSRTGDGNGSITTETGSFICPDDCQSQFDEDTVITLVATPEDGSDFNGWEGDADCQDGSITIQADIQCVAIFSLQPSMTVVEGIMLEGRNRSVLVSWQVLESATAYNVYWSTDAGMTPNNYAALDNSGMLAGVNGEQVVADLLPNKTYYFLVTALFVDDEGPAGDAQDVLVGPTQLRILPDSQTRRCTDTTQEVECPGPEAYRGQDGDYVINPPQYTVDGEVVIDELTQLRWQFKHQADVTFAEAQAYCGKLAADGFAGINNWRLPDYQEMVTLMDSGKSGTTIVYPEEFPYYPQNMFFWTSDEISETQAYAGSGNWSGMSIRNKTESYLVRCVSGQQIADDWRVDDNNVTVTDWVSGLQWQHDLPETKMAWSEGLAYCEGLDLAGATNWRMPNLKETQSIVDTSLSLPAVNPVFGDTPVESFWTSTPTLPGAGDDMYIVNMRYGTVVLNEIHTNSHWVRCVRGPD